MTRTSSKRSFQNGASRSHQVLLAALGAFSLGRAATAPARKKLSKLAVAAGSELRERLAPALQSLGVLPADMKRRPLAGRKQSRRRTG